MLRISQATRQLGVTSKTLRQWEQEGKIHPVRTPGGQRRYPQSEINRLLGRLSTIDKTPRCVIYARVSSQKQVKDGNLDRQRDRLELYAARKGYQTVEVLTEVASGLNENRRKLKKLLSLANDGKADIVLVEFKDRLARFGFKYLEQYFRAFDVTLEIVNGDEPKSAQEELVEDMLAILSSFSARLYGQRSSTFRKKVKQAIDECTTQSAVTS